MSVVTRVMENFSVEFVNKLQTLQITVRFLVAECDFM